MDVSKKGLSFITSFEGYRAECYDDAVGNCTIGVGHLVHKGKTTTKDRKKWGTLTRDEALTLLARDAGPVVNSVNQNIKVELTQPQFDALVSLGFNAGVGAVLNLAPVVNSKPKKWNLVKILAWRSRVKVDFMTWDHASGKVLLGLQRRRAAEACLFTTGKYTLRTGNLNANA